MSYDDYEDDDIDVDKEGYEDDDDDEYLGSGSRARTPFSSSPSTTSRLPGAGSGGSSGYAGRYSSGGSTPPSSGTPSRYSSGGSGPSSTSGGGSGAGSGSTGGYGGSSASRYGSGTGASGSSSSTGAGGSSASRYGSGSSSSPSSFSTSNIGGSSSASRYGSPSASSGSSSASSASASSSPADKKDDKAKEGGSKNPLSGALGGLTSRFKSGGDDKGGAAKSGDSGGSKNPLSGALGGLTSRFKSGGDDKGGAAKSGDSGGSKNPLSGALGGLTNRFKGGGDKADSKPAASASSAASSPSRMGGGGATTSAAGGGSGSGAQFGSRSSAAPSSGAAAKADSGGGGASIGDKFKGMFSRFGGGAKGESKPSTREKAAKAERASKAPKVEHFGLTLDNWLDIIGVALVLGALALTFSSASATKGQLTEAVNTFLSQLVGVGALAVPIAMFAVGLWLIIRHFGDEAPVVDPVRLVGIGLMYISLLVALQYYDSIYSMYTLSLLDAFLALSIEAGRGGGWLGAQVYRLLVLNITEVGGVFVVLGMMFISIMLILRISAADIAVFVISLWRSFMDSRKRRAQQREVEARQQAARLAAAAQSTISVTKPAVAELPGETSPALPAGSAGALPEPREIPITMGGRTVSASLTGDEANTQLPEAIPVPLTAEPTANPSLASRFFSAIPGRGNAEANPAELTPSDKPAGSGAMAKLGRFGAMGGLLKRGAKAEDGEKAATEATPATTTSQPAATSTTPAPTTLKDALVPPTETSAASPTASTAPVTASAQSAVTPPAESPVSPTTASAAPAPVKLEDDAEAAVPRIRDLMGSDSRTSTPAASTESPAASATPARSYGSYLSGKAAVEASQNALPVDDADEDSEDLSTLPPASPKGTARVSSIYGESTTPAASAASAAPKAVNDDADDDDDDEQLNRSSRLDQLRQGMFKGTGGSPSSSNPAPSPASSTPASSSAASAYPSDRISARDSASSSTPTPETTAPAASTQQPMRSTTPSPAYGRPAGPAAVPAPLGSNSGKRRNWSLPDYKGLLYAGSETDFDRESLLQRARTIEETLQSFGAPGRVVEVNTGPVITQFGVEPDYLTMRSGKKNRVKVGAIAQLDKDLQLALGAKSIRIEAPVPGKGYVGIEVPNEEASLVSLRDVMESEHFQKLSKKSPLAIGLGQSVDGTPISADLTTMPHLLIAGTTGSGKSVCVNAIIASILLMNPPDKVKFIMVDPKRVELTGYNGIPHLVAPVVVDLERTVGVLKWVTREMDDRYKKFSNAASRNIVDYNRNLSPNEEPMPYIVVIIDELADLMMLAPDETERVITRIAAMARATGIHLVIATQRPSVDVVTGLIKANFPARIAFAVAGGVDSRVILDQPGAERLLGRGDMLYLSGDSPAALRLQGVYVSDDEIDNITRYWRQVGGDSVNTRPISAFMGDDEKESARPVTTSGSRFGSPITSSPSASRWDSEPLFADDDDEDNDGLVSDDRDELYDQAVEMVRRNKKASVSMLQRKLRIGYTRAARLIDTMEEEGIVGPAKENSSKPRDVLVMD